MDRVGQLVTRVPPVTRYWLLLIIASATLTSLGWCSYKKILFTPQRTFWSQPWRLITAFCHFEGLSFSLLVRVYYMMGSALDLESKFTTPLSMFPPRRMARLSESKHATLRAMVEAYKIPDYLYYMASIAALIIVVVTIGYYKLGINVSELSTVLDSVIWYIWCRQNPQSPVVIFGLFSIPGAYVPWCLTVMHAITQIDFAHQVYASLLLEASAVRLAVYMPFLWNEFVNYTVGHFWWFSRDFLLANVYFDKNEERRKIAWSETRQTQREYAGRGPLTTSDLLRLFMLPPWYWSILNRVEAMPESDENDENEQNQNDQNDQNDQTDEISQFEQNDQIEHNENDRHVLNGNENQVQVQVQE